MKNLPTLKSSRIPLLVVALLVVTAANASATITIKLNNSFINQYANRVTMTATLHVDAAASKPHPAVEDGDEHAAGTSATIGLATVAEIMNANGSDEQNGVTDLANSPGKDISLVGVWRIWPEHGGSSNDFTQGGDVPAIDGTNPPHVFEIHPILSIDNIPLQSSFIPIDGYPPKDAETAFQAYDRTSCQITGDATTTTVVTDMIGYNYVRYRLAITNQAQMRQTDDGGLQFYGQVEAVDQSPTDSDLIANKVRMVVPPGTPAFAKIQGMTSGNSVVVWGIPRLDLSLVRYRATHPDASQWSLPYEMVVVGFENGS